MKEDLISTIYKIEEKSVWNDAITAGVYLGAPIDLADGFIHFSTAAQARETAAKHFTGRAGLIIAAINVSQLAPDLKWEISRGDALFPHLYNKLDMSAVIKTYDMPLAEDGTHIFDGEIV